MWRCSPPPLCGVALSLLGVVLRSSASSAWCCFPSPFGWCFATPFFGKCCCSSWVVLLPAISHLFLGGVSLLSLPLPSRRSPLIGAAFPEDRCGDVPNRVGVSRLGSWQREGAGKLTVSFNAWFGLSFHVVTPRCHRLTGF